ncbi:MAG: hypothetical protein ABI721_02405 [Candidatus Dojkabacteria bacterium]
MKKILVISQKESEAYQTLEEFLQRKFLDKRISSNFSTYADVEIYVDNQSNANIFINGIDILTFDYVYLRIPQKNLELANSIAKFLKHNNKKFGDSYLAAPQYGYKLFQSICANINNIIQPKTVYFNTARLLNNYEKIVKFLGEPFVIKRTSSDKGKNNFIIKDKNDWARVYKELSIDKNHICQEWISNSKDYRIFLENFKIGSVETRQRIDKSEHRNNASLGGIEEFIKPEQLPQNIIEECENLSTIFGLNICGLDLIQSDVDNKFYFIEANHSPGITYDTVESDALFSNIIKEIVE